MVISSEMLFATLVLLIFKADEAYHIGSAPARDSYLSMEKIMQVAKMSRSQVRIAEIFHHN